MKAILSVLSVALFIASPVGHARDPSVIADVLQPYIDRHELAGAVTFVVSKDKVLNRASIGYRDIAARKRMQTDTLFWIASTSKPITAVALMMLVDEGRVNVDDPVAKYLPRFSSGITIRHLLTHTSGLPTVSRIESPTLDSLPLAVRVDSYADEPLLHAPGAQFSYSNAGFNTIGRIVEIVAEVPFETFLQRRLFDPLGMTDTTFFPTQAQLRRLARSYKPNAAKSDLEETPIPFLRHPLSDRQNRYAMPAGGLFSTAGDMSRLAQMLLNGGTRDGRRYLSESAVGAMTRPQISEDVRKTIPGAGDEISYGLGWGVGLSGGFFHPGMASTDLIVDPSRRIATVFMLQHADPSSFAMRAAVMKAAEDAFAR